MKKVKILIVAIITLMSFGCAQVSKEFNKQFSEKFKSTKSSDGIYSKYQPNLKSTKNLDKHLAELKSVNNQIVSDEQGIYYHTVTDLGLYRTFFNKQDAQKLKNLFSSSVGLMAPVYYYIDDRGPKLAIDWKETKKRHHLFVTKLKLNLLPLSETRKYQKTFEKEALAIGNNYNYSTLPNIIKKSKVKADYLIRTGLEEDYFINYRIKISGLRTMDKKSLDYTYRRLIVSSSAIYFTPIDLLDQTKSGNARMISGCIFRNTDAYREEFDKNHHQFREFFRSHTTDKSKTYSDTREGRRQGIKDNEDREYNKSLNRFLAQLPLQKNNHKRVEKACIDGFSKMKVSGTLKSFKLD